MRSARTRRTGVTCRCDQMSLSAIGLPKISAYIIALRISSGWASRSVRESIGAGWAVGFFFALAAGLAVRGVGFGLIFFAACWRWACWARSLFSRVWAAAAWACKATSGFGGATVSRNASRVFRCFSLVGVDCRRGAGSGASLRSICLSTWRRWAGDISGAAGSTARSWRLRLWLSKGLYRGFCRSSVGLSLSRFDLIFRMPPIA